MSTQQEKFTAIANAIRAKKGTTAAIAANDFATEIASIEIGNTESDGVAPSEPTQYYLYKKTLTKDDGFEVEKIAISVGDVIDLGSEDVEASSYWGNYYKLDSHPAMTHQGWASTLDVDSNQITIPDTLTSDYYVTANYTTSDGLNYLIRFNNPTQVDDETYLVAGYERVIFDDSEVSTAYTTSTYSSNIFTNQVTAVWIGGDITSIGTYAFYGCTSLASITLPDSITSIGTYAFFGCTSLASITLPDSITSIGIQAFQGCTSLTSINIPSGVTSLGTSSSNSVFYNCTSLASVTFNEGATTVPSYAFYGCTSLASITLPDSITSIGIQAFQGCTSLTSINIPSGVTSLGTSSSNSVFYNCTSLASVTLPDSITSIGTSSFYNCTSLVSVTLPDSITSIGTSSFYNCTSLVSVTLPDSSSILTLDNVNAFTNSLCTFFVPTEDDILAYEEATNWSSFIGRFIENTEENRKLYGLW